ncbi:uncharacterized protein PRCAT00005547001 [Priceomyces carsonii]|uniref:uncharacterized protein n=1 Tax=Priceomyces carsonii TaxID=28549 RepID=UPI002ED7C427|nr:unnamed protein product [Priceomyces carsonii]
MSKRYSIMGKGPDSQTSDDKVVNPYEDLKRKSELEKHRKELFQKYHSPKIIIDDDPIIPKFRTLENSKRHADYNMKLVVVGDGGCGKTCLLVSYVQHKFPEIYVPTVFENYVASVAAPNNKLIELALWDTAGQEEYDRLRPLSYPDADILLICFSLDNITSLQNVKDTWFPEVSHFCPGIPIILVGTKADLHSLIDSDLPIQVATDINAIGYIQCSAKTMFNVKTVFNFALNQFQKQQQMQEQLDKSSKKRLSKVLGGGHTRNQSSTSRGHNKNTSIASSILLDTPLAEDEYQSNPYGTFSPNKYNEEEFAFTRKDAGKRKKKRRCIIL